MRMAALSDKGKKLVMMVISFRLNPMAHLLIPQGGSGTVIVAALDFTATY